MSEWVVDELVPYITQALYTNLSEWVGWIVSHICLNVNFCVMKICVQAIYSRASAYREGGSSC